MPFEPGRAKTGGKRRGYKSMFSVKELEKSFKKAKKAHGGVSFLDYLTDLAYQDHVVAIALLKKLMPDMRQIEVMKRYTGGYADLTPQETIAEMLKATMGDEPDAV